MAAVAPGGLSLWLRDTLSQSGPAAAELLMPAPSALQGGSGPMELQTLISALPDGSSELMLSEGMWMTHMMRDRHLLLFRESLLITKLKTLRPQLPLPKPCPRDQDRDTLGAA